MRKKYKVRFNLGKGKNFMFWQVINTETGSFKYYNPSKVSIVMSNCFLRNQKATANKIFNGSNKSVCAWVECDNVIIIKDSNLSYNSFKVSYNPRKSPNWQNNKGENIDSLSINCLYTVDTSIFAGNKGRQLLMEI